MNNRNVLLIAFLVLLISMIVFNLESGITGNTISNSKTKISVDRNKVVEGGTIKVIVTPGSNGIINPGYFLTSPVYLNLYRVSETGEGKRTPYKLKVCDHNKCYNSITRYFRIPSGIIPGLTPTERFYLRGVDGDSKQEIRAYFTVENS